MAKRIKVPDKQVQWAREFYDPHDKRRSFAAIGRKLNISRMWASKIVRGEGRKDAGK